MTRILVTVFAAFMVFAWLEVSSKPAANVTAIGDYAMNAPTPTPSPTSTQSPLPSPTVTPTPYPEPEPVSPTPTPFNYSHAGSSH
jgi:hypothetical protein